jgi:nucleoside-diphosphate-sugar epimerase
MKGVNKMKAFIIGGTGFIGSGIARAMKGHGYEVQVLCRTDANANRLRQEGFVPVMGDMVVAGEWQSKVEDSDVIVYAAQIRPGKRISSAWLRNTRQARNSALNNVIETILGRENKCKAFIYTSGIVAHGSHGDSWVDESSPATEHAMGEYHLEGEKIMRQAAIKGLPAMTIRPGMVYGPNGTFGEFFLAEAKKGVYRFPGTGENYLSWVHIDDLGNAYVKAAENPAIGEVVSVVDDVPMKLKDFSVALLKPFGGGKSVSVPSWVVSLFAGKPLSQMLTSSYRVRNDKAKRLFDWKPLYPQFSDGIPNVVEQYSAK